MNIGGLASFDDGECEKIASHDTLHLRNFTRKIFQIFSRLLVGNNQETNLIQFNKRSRIFNE